MSDQKTLLVIWHSRTGASEQMAQAAGEHTNTRLIRAQDVTANDLFAAAGYLFVAPENLAALSGAMKEMSPDVGFMRKLETSLPPVNVYVKVSESASVAAALHRPDVMMINITTRITGWSPAGA